MYCQAVTECFEEINAYCTGDSFGYPFLVNVENFTDFQTILQRLEADSRKQCIFVSQLMRKNGLPVMEDAFVRICEPGTFALIGVSQAMMLSSEDELDRVLDELLGLSVAGHVIVLLSHCRKFLERYQQRDPRLRRRVILVEGISSPLPQIRLTDNESVCIGFKPLTEIQGLLAYLERMNDEKLQAHPFLTVLTRFKPSLFSEALYSVSESKGVFAAVCQKYPDLAIAQEGFGTGEQWAWLLKEMEGFDTFSALICKHFGAIINLPMHLPKVMENKASLQMWLLWLAMHVFGTGTNRYLAEALGKSESAETFESAIYNTLLEIKYDDPRFETYYSERKQVLNSLPENRSLMNEYCDQVGRHGKYSIYYLTSSSERERYEFAKCLSVYDYTEDEINNILKEGFQEIYSYMQPFNFDILNTRLPETDSVWRKELTEYFVEYKQQKLTNRIDESFMVKVERQAIDRPFMKLQPRSSIVSKIVKEDTGFFFIDALGVEYLSYIQNKCEKYGMLFEVSIGRCELPSITSENKEFENTCPGVKKISDLDELKHHSVEYDYTECPYPIHLFQELEIIDKELRRIQAQLTQGIIQKAVILSDHGASRLAVLYGKESSSRIELEEKGLHSGRCCKIEEDPELAQASYEDGYAVLANYERFKGGRAANLEVHGGASLEEVLVPVITLTRKPENITYCFVEHIIKFKMGQDVKITLFSNAPMKNPRIQVNNVFYDGIFTVDNKHAEFTMPELKRSNTYEALIYEGDKYVDTKLEFTIERATRQRNLFG